MTDESHICSVVLRQRSFDSGKYFHCRSISQWMLGSFLRVSGTMFRDSLCLLVLETGVDLNGGIEAREERRVQLALHQIQVRENRFAGMHDLRIHSQSKLR